MLISTLKARTPLWFSPSTMAFFASRVEGSPRLLPDGRAYFITSERYQDEPRTFTVRVSHLNADNSEWIVDTVGEFQEHATYADALAALKLAMPPRYWVLPVGAYPDDETSYVRADSIADAKRLAVRDLGYLQNPGSWVYAGDRTPWTEVDPYPDFIAESGPRGGIRWERA